MSIVFASEATNSATPVSTATLPTIPLLGLRVITARMEPVIAHLLDGTRRRVTFVNAHCLNVAAHDAAYSRALSSSDAVLPDGIGVSLAARMSGQRIAENLNGTDFVPNLLRQAALQGRSVFLFGAAPGVAQEAAARLVRDIPGLRIAGTRDGFDGAADEGRAISAINVSGADILLVAMGVPQQDLWLARNAHRLAPALTLGVGALFDFLAGRVWRAPAPVRKARLEWVWRLAMEPRRMARRYLVGNVTFLARAARHAAAHTAATPRRDPMGKRALDIAIAGSALLLLAPVLLMTAAAIRLDSRGPVLFRQTRIGRDGTPFAIFKFRSMHIDAEARRAALLATSDRAGVCFKSKSDPRVTRMGRLLRRTSVDELPQILNGCAARCRSSARAPRCRPRLPLTRPARSPASTCAPA